MATQTGVADRMFRALSDEGINIEAISVILQIGSYKLRDGKRIFRMAPFHHHMELGGLAETKVVIRLWITAIIATLPALPRALSRV